MEVPGCHVPEQAVLVVVEAMVPLRKLHNASGREARRPYLKVVTFLAGDGPRRTLRKVRAKRDEPLYTGDLHVAALLGHAPGSGERLVALGCRVPPGTQQVAVHRQLVHGVGEDYSVDDLIQVAGRLTADGQLIDSLGRQNYLYSGTAPPVELLKLLDEAVTTGQGDRPVPPTPYGVVRPPKGPDVAASTVLRWSKRPNPQGTLAAVLGAGDYARTEILPALAAAGIGLYSVADREPQIAAMAGRAAKAVLASTDSEQAIAELPRQGLVVVATTHDSHTDLACVAAGAGHRVFLEKPPTVTASDVARLTSAMRQFEGRIEVGFNRRYHPIVRRAAARLRSETGPVSVVCTVKELSLQPDHWYLWPNQGTRITGNLCHWIDLAVFLMEDRPLPVTLTLSPRPPGRQSDDEERVLTVTFEDGSLLTILATSRGDDIRGVQEQIEVRRGRATVTIDDLRRMRVRSEGIDRHTRTAFRDKAHARMYAEALGRVVRDEPAVYPVRDMIVVSAIQIGASELARSGEGAGELPAWMASLLTAG